MRSTEGFPARRASESTVALEDVRPYVPVWSVPGDPTNPDECPLCGDHTDAHTDADGCTERGQTCGCPLVREPVEKGSSRADKTAARVDADYPVDLPDLRQKGSPAAGGAS